jgi:hypothetical protein
MPIDFCVKPTGGFQPNGLADLSQIRHCIAARNRPALAIGSQVYEACVNSLRKTGKQKIKQQQLTHAVHPFRNSSSLRLCSPALYCSKLTEGFIYALASLRSCRAGLQFWIRHGRLSPINLCLYR